MRTKRETVDVQLRCRKCRGRKVLSIPGPLWWQCWKTIECPGCQGKGFVIVQIERPEPPRLEETQDESE